MSRGPRLAALSCAAALLAGCAGGPAPSVAAPARLVETEPARFRISLELAAHAGAARLRLPLPSSDARQEVSLLVWEVGAPGAYAVREDGGERVLEVEAPPGGPLPPVRLLAEVRRPRDRSWRALPRALVVGRALEPRAWVAHARRAGAQARVVHGLEVDLDQRQAQPCAWPELREDAGWVPVDPRQGRIGLDPFRIRLGVTPPDLELRGGEHLDPPLQLSVSEVGAG